MSDDPGQGGPAGDATVAGEPSTGEPITDLSLAEVLAAAAEGIADVTLDDDGSTTTWSVGGHAFAALAGDWAEFRLDPAVARAALRTPDAADSPRGPGWVSFAPAVLDDPAIDHAEAWFLSAHRHATAIRH